jgi:glucans biosynthesis protein C
MILRTSVEAGSASPTAPAKGSRLLFVDNLRWVMIVLVVVVHLAVTYSGLGGWYYKDHGELGMTSFLAFAFLEMHLQAFFMGLLFLVAGYFVPGAYDRKGPKKFLADRAFRLGLPTLLYALVIEPFIAIALLGYLQQHNLSLGAAYAGYIVTLQFLAGTGPLWFTLALLVFSGVYIVMRLATKRRGLWETAQSKVPSQRSLLALAGGIAVGAFLVRLVLPIGTEILNLQLCFFVQYVVLFIVGTQAYRGDWLRRLPDGTGVSCLRWGGIGGPVAWLTMMWLGGARTGDFSPFFGGLRWQSGAYAAWESFFCVTMCVGLVVWFRDHFDWQGRFAKFMSDNAFAVYVFHAPILVSLAKVFHGVAIHPGPKFLLLCAVSLPACFLFAHFIARRVPGLRRLL